MQMLNVKTMQSFLRLDKFEVRQPANSETLDTPRLIEKLNNIVDAFWEEKNDIGYIKTDIKSEQAYSLAAQAYLCHAYIHLAKTTGQDKFTKRAVSLGNYLAQHQEETGLFLFHNFPGKPQDEGPATFSSIITLSDLFEHTQNEQYLCSAIKAGNAAREFLFKEMKGYIHTIGQSSWCPNVSITATEAYWCLFQLTKEEKYEIWTRDGLANALCRMAPNGMFPYSEHRRDIYITVYQAYILWILLWLKETGLSGTIIKEKVDKGLEYLGSLCRDDGSLIEPEMPEVYAYSHSVAASAAAWTRSGNKQRFESNMEFLSKFLYKGKLYTYMDWQGKLFMGNRRYHWKSYVVRNLEMLVS